MLTVENDWRYGGTRAGLSRCRTQQGEETSVLFLGKQDKRKKKKRESVRSSERHCRK